MRVIHGRFHITAVIGGCFNSVFCLNHLFRGRKYQKQTETSRCSTLMKSLWRCFKETTKETIIFSVIQRKLWSLAVKKGGIIQLESHRSWYKYIEHYWSKIGGIFYDHRSKKMPPEKEDFLLTISKLFCWFRRAKRWRGKKWRKRKLLLL